MSRSTSLAALAIAALLSSVVVACADTDQPDKYEAFGGSGSATSTSDLTSSTTDKTDADAAAAAPKTDAELEKEDHADLSNHASKSADRSAKKPLIGN